MSRLTSHLPFLALGVASCAPTPRLETSLPVASPDWSIAPARQSAPGTRAASTTLGAALGSPELAELIARAFAASPRLRVAGERVEEARALARSARGAGLNVVGIASGAVGRGGGLGFGGGDAQASLTPDLSGEGRARDRAAGARSQAAEQERQAEFLRTAAEIAQTYVQRAALTHRIALVDRSIAQSAELERVVGLRVREGESSRVELGLQAVRAGRLRAERSRLAGAAEQSRIALALLVGAEAPGFTVAAADLTALTPPEPAIPSPAMLVLARSDLRAAEARLQAAGGDVSAARRAFLPGLNISVGQVASAGLTGGIGLAADLLGPIFNRGRLKGSLDAASARQRAAAFGYRQAMLSALAEVEGAMSAAATAKASALALGETEQQARITAGFAQRRYLEGEAGLQEVLDAQDLLIAAQDGGALTREAHIGAGIALWLATGTPAS